MKEVKMSGHKTDETLRRQDPKFSHICRADRRLLVVNLVRWLKGRSFCLTVSNTFLTVSSVQKLRGGSTC